MSNTNSKNFKTYATILWEYLAYVVTLLRACVLLERDQGSLEQERILVERNELTKNRKENSQNWWSNKMSLFSILNWGEKIKSRQRIPHVLYAQLFYNNNFHSESSIHLVKNQIYHSRTKYINVKYHFIREILEKCQVSIQNIKTKTTKNPATIMTKVVTNVKFNICLDWINNLKFWSLALAKCIGRHYRRLCCRKMFIFLRCGNVTKGGVVYYKLNSPPLCFSIPFQTHL